MLTRQADAQGLCKRVLGLEAPRQETQACIGFERGKCTRGRAWARRLTSHHARLLSGLSRHRFPVWPWSGPAGLAEGPDWAPALHVFDRWAYWERSTTWPSCRSCLRNRVPASIRRWSS